MTLDEKIERFEQVVRVLEAMPPHEREKHWDMGTYGRVTACGTVACAAGHCSLDPWFRERGFSSHVEETSLAALLVPDDGKESHSESAKGRWFDYVRKFFGAQEELELLDDMPCSTQLETQTYDRACAEAFACQTCEVFFDGTHRSVDTVIDEIKRHLEDMYMHREMQRVGS